MVSIAKLPKYEAYRDSGVDWLGDVPAHWNDFPLCAKSELKSISGKEDEELLSVYLDRGVIKFDDVDAKRTNATSTDLSKYQLVEPGDFVLNNQQAWRGSVGVSAYRGIVSPAYLILSISKDICPKYGNYLFRDGVMVANYLVSSKGVGTIQRNLYWPQLKRARIFLPALSEQELIADFLDKKTTQIDEAIAIKEQQIALLKERKQIIIQKAVTQGLDPNVPLKDSGVGWIGKLPAHWEVRRSKFLFTQRKERAWKDDVQLSATQAYGVIPQDRYEELTGYRVVKIQFHLDKRKHVEKDDFVISMRSFQGGLERAWARGCIRSSYVVLRPLEEIDPAFYGYLLKLPAYIAALQQTASFIRDGQDLNFDNFSKVDLFIPPVDEQREIANYISAFMASSDRGIDLLLAQIEKLKEYKTTLINSAVTGKIKVTPEMVEA
ncbi:MAG: restriction endonuclease subunit S [Marinobacter sp.]|jgi:type I restriction enzyme S subunit|uniref:restriction endonuclease subunit S n=1 Tax=Marinobacter TaxID=2742 RepID=UPI00241F1604|nr:restriction endonuclease subunit S [Marinobacter nauticus]|tara:strand:+ start:1174 stop:2481 length:1308 start_codon:yes stop_codon:yes gene_type:complete